MKRWYSKSIVRIFHRVDKEVLLYLNKLNDNGVSPEEIKISEPTTLYVNIYYYSDKEVK